MASLTFEQVQIKFDQAIDFVETGQPPTITQKGEPAAMLFSFKEDPELLRLRHAARFDGLLSCAARKCPIRTS